MSQSTKCCHRQSEIRFVCGLFLADRGAPTAMPTYEYHCETCDKYFELRQSFTDDPIVECLDTKCMGRVKKVFGNVGIAFKGSGFYKTDSRSKAGGSDSGSSGSQKTAGKSEASSESKSTSDSTKPSANESKSSSGDSKSDSSNK
jgi:putative FmdB family regulatory protein